MPELPEVETIRLGLEKYLIGHEIQNIEVRLPRIFNGDPVKCKGAKVQRVRRLGKGLIIDLDNSYSIAVHVKMTGQLLYTRGSSSAKASADKPATRKLEVDSLPDKYTHVIFKLDNDALLFYRDMRQFGWVKVLQSKDVPELSFFKSLGPEFFKDLDLEKFRDILERNRMPIKQVIMDQAKMAGVGNIYANDGLYLAGIHPKRPANSLNKKEQKVLFMSLEKVMKKGIETGGASEWHYVDVLGGSGKYQEFFQIYNKKGKSCKNCGSIIEKITLGGRGTFYCPQCQVDS